MNKIRILPFCSVLALGAALALGGCSSGKKPPALAVSKPAAVTIPAPETPKDKALFGYAKLRDPVGLSHKLFGLAAPVMLSQMDLNINELKPGRTVAVFGWDPGDGPVMAAPVAAVIPAPADGQLVAKLSRLAPSAKATPLGESTLLALNPAGAERAAAEGQALGATAEAKTPFDLLLLVHMDSVMAKYGPQLQKMLAQIPLNGSRDQPGMEGATQSGRKILEEMIDRVSAMKALSIGAQLSDSALELALITDDKQAGDKAGPVAAPDLAQFMPPGQVRFQWHVRDVQKIADFYLRTYAPVLDSKPALKQQIQQLVAEWQKAGRSQLYAGSMSFGGEKFMQISALMKVDNGKAAMAAVRKGIALFDNPELKEVYKNLGIEMSMTSQPGVRKLHGWPVDRYAYTFKVTKPELQQAAGLLSKLSGMTYEIVQVGDYLAFTIGGTVDELVNSLMTGKGAGGLAAMKQFPAGGGFYADVDVMRIAKAAAAMSGREVSLPELPPGAQTLTLWSYDAGQTAMYKASVPRPLIDLAISAAMRPPGAPPP
ncbi:MAG: hypothetical protein U1A78_07720 [Polyangia bacterium]